MEWIAMKTRLPNEGEKVLVRFDSSDENSFVISATYNPIKTNSSGPDGWSFPGCLCELIWTEEITHWLPLPAPPKDK